MPLSVSEKILEMKKTDLEDILETGNKTEQYYALKELNRRKSGGEVTPQEYRKGGAVKKKVAAKKPAVKKPAVKKSVKKGK